MDDLIEKIRAATMPNAADDARAAGVDACRTLLVALEAKAGEPMARPTVEPTIPPSLAPSSSPTPLAIAQALVTALRGMSPDQLLDVAIARLRAALPPGATMPVVQPLKVQLIPINRSVSP